MTSPATNGDTRYLARPGGRIGYDVTGEGPLVVCIPGMGDLRGSFRFLVPALAAAGYRVATMDLRGHGDSDATFETYDDVAAGSDALALIAELGGPAVIVGNSMGAGAAAWAAAETPDAVAGVVLVGPFVRNPPSSAVATLLFRLLLLKPWGPAALLGWYDKLMPGERPADHAAYKAALKANLAKPGHWAGFQRTSHTSHAPVEARLGYVRTPVLVVMGDRDPDFKDPAAEARWIADRLGGSVVMVPGTGHYPQAQAPAVVNAAVLAFLAEALPVAPRA
ncbi:MAG: alpha/beta hydrolase [Chloroflexota bacterium]